MRITAPLFSTGAHQLRRGGSYRVRYRPRGSDDDWVTEEVEGLELVVDELNFCGTFEVEVASLCGGEAGPGSLFNFSETCVSTDDARLPDVEWQLVPNPAIDHFRLTYRPGTLRPARWRLVDVTGRVLQTAWALSTDITGDNVDLRGVPAGIYFVELTAEDGRRGGEKTGGALNSPKSAYPCTDSSCSF